MEKKEELYRIEDKLEYLDNEKSNIEKLFYKLLEKLSKIESFKSSNNSYQNKNSGYSPYQNNSSSTKNSNWLNSMRNKFPNTSESSNKIYVKRNDKTNGSATDYIKRRNNK